MPPELAMQLPLIKEVMNAMKITNLEAEGFEADDIIGTVARIAEEEGLKPLIITGDKDALQLCGKVTEVLITRRGISEFDLFDHDKMLERYELTPSQFVDLKGLMGDSSDNIPGIPGVGEKTGIKLLKQFGTVENLVANTEEISKVGFSRTSTCLHAKATPSLECRNYLFVDFVCFRLPFHIQNLFQYNQQLF